MTQGLFLFPNAVHFSRLKSLKSVSVNFWPFLNLLNIINTPKHKKELRKKKKTRNENIEVRGKGECKKKVETIKISIGLRKWWKRNKEEMETEATTPRKEDTLMRI